MSDYQVNGSGGLWTTYSTWVPNTGYPGMGVGDTAEILMPTTVSNWGSPANSLSSLTITAGGTLQVGTTINGNSAGVVTLGGGGTGNTGSITYTGMGAKTFYATSLTINQGSVTSSASNRRVTIQTTGTISLTGTASSIGTSSAGQAIVCGGDLDVTMAEVWLTSAATSSVTGSLNVYEGSTLAPVGGNVVLQLIGTGVIGAIPTTITNGGFSLSLNVATLQSYLLETCSAPLTLSAGVLQVATGGGTVTCRTAYAVGRHARTLRNIFGSDYRRAAFRAGQFSDQRRRYYRRGPWQQPKYHVLPQRHRRRLHQLLQHGPEHPQSDPRNLRALYGDSGIASTPSLPSLPNGMTARWSLSANADTLSLIIAAAPSGPPPGSLAMLGVGC